jgi:hypothetical protein
MCAPGKMIRAIAWSGYRQNAVHPMYVRLTFPQEPATDTAAVKAARTQPIGGFTPVLGLVANR